MAKIKDILRKANGHVASISLLDLAILLFHVHRGAQEENVGFEDARETLDSFLGKLNKNIEMDPTLLESALWSANLLDEIGKWWHPEGLSFDEWVKKLASGQKYNRIYCVLERK